MMGKSSGFGQKIKLRKTLQLSYANDEWYNHVHSHWSIAR